MVSKSRERCFFLQGTSYVINRLLEVLLHARLQEKTSSGLERTAYLLKGFGVHRLGLLA